jgi:hypothetical protein
MDIPDYGLLPFQSSSVEPSAGSPRTTKYPVLGRPIPAPKVSLTSPALLPMMTISCSVKKSTERMKPALQAND